MQISLRTVLAIAVIFALPLSIFGIITWRTRSAYRGSCRWPLANLFYAVAFLLFPLRAVVPDWMSVVGANALIVVAAILCLEATREFRSLRPAVPGVYTAGLIAILAVVYFNYLDNTINARIMAMSVFLGAVAILCSLTLLRKLPLRGRPGIIIGAVLFAIVAVVHIARGIYFAFAPPLDDVLASTLGNSIFFIVSALSIACSSVGWTMLSNEQLAMVLEDAERRTTKTAQALAEATGRAESMEQRARNAEFANRALLNMVNHEVRNSLGSVSAMLDLLADTRLTAEQQECALAMRTGVQTLLSLNNDILDLACIDTGDLKIAWSRFSLIDLMEDVARVHKPLARSKDLDIVVEYPAALPRLLVGDGARIRQVLMNLVAQAVKFKREGQVLIAAVCEEVDGVNARIGIIVTGSSSSLSPDNASAPQLFSQASAVDPAIAQDAGIGLSLSGKLIGLMGGKLHMERNAGWGANFWFSIPLEIARIETAV